PLRARLSTPPDVPSDVGEYDHPEADREVRAVAGGVVVDRVDVAAREIANARPDRHPERGADRVEEDEPGPVHSRRAGDDPVRVAQPFDETRDDDDLAAVALEEARGSVEPLGREEDVAAVAFHERATAEVPDPEADVVADDRAEEAE